ncbi:Lrp/AsnC family transcriptional regulator [Actinopolyspora saharensis]|uniref:DNA-binding transcriptional regulator, Lrp family n=1 Tax=Actinopolyspora saharensis TaxID=995062 RepID=A0A1H0YGQ4_9ACTN|nr:Lrp/AsnC family transcriptional regulator [Actinopolyspora saharensis]SDQ14056.1 DNA-binding transcriptional regulator, Lrp family [Actinopolyspora saharensis]
MAQSIKLDPVDLQILAALQNNARISNKELAATVDIAASTCLDRVNRLRETGVILGYGVKVDPEKLGRPLQALLYIRVQPHRRPLVDPFVEHVLTQPETRELYHLTGPDDFLLHVAAENARALQRLVLDELTAREEVALVHTNLIFQHWDGKPLLPPTE